MVLLWRFFFLGIRVRASEAGVSSSPSSLFFHLGVIIIIPCSFCFFSLLAHHHLCCSSLSSLLVFFSYLLAFFSLFILDFPPLVLSFSLYSWSFSSYSHSRFPCSSFPLPYACLLILLFLLLFSLLFLCYSSPFLFSFHFLLSFIFLFPPLSCFLSICGKNHQSLIRWLFKVLFWIMFRLFNRKFTCGICKNVVPRKLIAHITLLATQTTQMRVKHS